MPRIKYTPEQKLKACKLDEQGVPASQIAVQVGIDQKNLPGYLYRWRKRYKRLGEQAFSQKKQPHCHPVELRQQILTLYFEQNIPVPELSDRFGMNPNTIHNWIYRYKHFDETAQPEPEALRTLNSYNESGKEKVRKAMSKAKKYTLEQQIAYITDYQSSGLSMAEYCRRQELSYSQFFHWISKYRKDGKNALIDRRGQRKKPEEISRQEQLEKELAQTRKALEDQKKITELLKKKYTMIQSLKDSLK